MPKRFRLLCILSVSVMLLALCPFAQASGKKKVSSEGDLPRFTYPVKGSASELREADDASFEAFAVKVRADVESILRDYDITDKATMRTLLQAEKDLETLAGEYPAALATTERFRAEQEKPSAKLTAGLFGQVWLQTAMETKSTSGPAFEESFRKLAADKVNALPWEVV
jgi:hypothetical protein